MQKSSDPFENRTEKAHDLPSIEAVSALIGAIYDCALDPGLWDATLVDLKEMFRCQGVILGMTDLASGDTILTKSVGIAPFWLEPLPFHAPEVASWQGLATVRNLPLDEPQVISVMCLSKSESNRAWKGNGLPPAHRGRALAAGHRAPPGCRGRSRLAGRSGPGRRRVGRGARLRGYTRAGDAGRALAHGAGAA